jgi:tetratricopeptide (TPR) repeat protein
MNKNVIIITLGIMLAAGSSPVSGWRRKNTDELVTMKIQEAKILMADEKYDESLVLLKKVVENYPQNAKAEIALATINHIYQIINFMDEAFNYFVELEKKHPKKKIGLVAAYLYIPILIKREQYDQAIVKSQEIFEKEPDSYWAIGALFNIANLYCRILNRESEGIAIYKKIIKQYPNTQFAKIAKMEISMRKK